MAAAAMMVRPAPPKSAGSNRIRSASSRPNLEFYMRPESRMSSTVIPTISQHEGESRARYGWRLIRYCVREAIDLSYKADMKDFNVHHGVHHMKKLLHAKPIQQMIYKKNTGEYVTIDGELVRIFYSDGRKKELVRPVIPFNRLIYAQQTDLYVGWMDKENTLMLMSPEFQVLSTSEAPGSIDRGIYNENLEEIITVGDGHMTSWVFRYGGRHLLPKKSFSNILTDVEISAVTLEGTISRSQRIFVAHKQSVTVLSLHEGEVVSQKSSMHSRDITCLLFFNPLKYLVTAAKDGCIKIWDENWHIQLVFVGHSGAVTSLCLYPFGTTIISASTDNTIRVWSMEACDELDCIKTEKPLLEMGTILNFDKFFSVSTSHADLWSIKNIHLLHTRIGQTVQAIKMTDHPQFPQRAVVLSKDSCVRVINPGSGNVLTTLLLSSRKQLVDAAYAVADDHIFACFSNGEMVKASTKTNPCKIVDEWKAESIEKSCRYLLVYEYCITTDMGGEDVWKLLARAGQQNRGHHEDLTEEEEEGGEGEYDGDSDDDIVKAALGNESNHKFVTSTANRTLLLGGRRDGYICVFDKDTGKVSFEVEAHGDQGVRSMIANSKQDQIITAGNDNLIKIWRIYPYAEEALTLMMTLFCAHTPVYMTMGKRLLSVAFQEHSSATYSVVMYHLGSKRRVDHGPMDDHTSGFVGLAACPRLKLVASASLDGTIRLFTEDNMLVRIVHLKDTPNSLSFCSEKASLLVGIGDNVHRIDYKNYLPMAYRFKMISMRLKDEAHEEPIEFNEALLKEATKEDIRKLKNARACFKFTHFMDILTADETEEVMRDKLLKQKAFEALEQREADMLKLIAGEVEPQFKRMPTVDTRREGFKKYLDLFYNRPKKNKLITDKPEFIKDKVKEILHGPAPKRKPEYVPEPEPTGFFKRPKTPAQKPESPRKSKGIFITEDQTFMPKQPSNVSRQVTDVQVLSKQPTSHMSGEPTPLDTSQKEKSVMSRQATFFNEKGLSSITSRPATKGMQTKEKTTLSTAASSNLPQTPATPIRPDGYIPNSVIAKLLFNGESEVEEEEVEAGRWAPAGLSEDQLKQIKPRIRSGQKTQDLSGDKTEVDEEPFHERVLMMDSDDEDSTAGGLRRPSVIQSLADMDPNYKGEIEIPGTPDDTPVSTPPPDEAIIEEKIADKGTVAKKFEPRAPPPKKPAPIVKVAAPRVEESPETLDILDDLDKFVEEANEPTPLERLPSFISDHIGKEWFDLYFPNCNETGCLDPETMPKPWTVENFIQMLCRVLRIAEFPHKVEVLEVISEIHEKHTLSDTSPVYKVLYSVLNHHTHPPSVQDPVEKEFIMNALELMVALMKYDEDFYVEIIALYLDGDTSVRLKVMKIWKQLGLKDPHNMLAKELQSWDIWGFDESTRGTDIRNMARKFIQEWIFKFRDSLSDAITRIQRGETVAGYVPSSSGPTSRTNVNKNNTGKKNASNNANETRQLAAALGMGGTPADKVTKTVQNILTMHVSPSLELLQTASSMDALNYFTEYKFSQNLRTRTSGFDKNQTLNTVLVLPKIPGKGTLVRLGETHTSVCHPILETSLDTRHNMLPPLTARGAQPLPGKLTGFPGAINLPMKPINMNPFPSPMDLLDPLYTPVRPIMIMLRMPQKYFRIDRSFPSASAS